MANKKVPPGRITTEGLGDPPSERLHTMSKSSGRDFATIGRSARVAGLRASIAMTKFGIAMAQGSRTEKARVPAMQRELARLEKDLAAVEAAA